MTLGKPSIWWICLIVHVIDPFITFTVCCLPIVAANDKHHNPLPLLPFHFICLCRYYSNLCESILIVPIISLITLTALSVGNFGGAWWWEGVAQCWWWWQGAMETHTSLTAAALLPCCQQFEQIMRAVMLCHKNLKESDQILSYSGCWTGSYKVS